MVVRTISLQTDALKQYVGNSGDELVETFLDEGVSGSLENRPGLALLFAHLDEHPETEGVLIFKLDWLARDLLVQETLIRELSKRNVRIISTKEPDLDSGDPSRTMIRQLFGMISEYERALITMRLSAGRHRKASGGGYSGGGVAVGYQTVDKELKLDPDRMEHVATIFRLRREGGTLRSIAALLNEQQIPVPRDGKQWWPGSVGYVLQNKTYKGRLTYKQHSIERPDLILPMTG